MSRSPHRHRADAGEVWRYLLFGEIVRTVDRPLVVHDEPTLRLPRSGRWESGLARVRPALDDALGATALATAWRWACAELDENAWPGLELLARKATDRHVQTGAMNGPWAVFEAGGDVRPEAGERTWRLEFDDRRGVELGVSGLTGIDWREVDRTADVLAAWLDRPWRVVG